MLCIRISEYQKRLINLKSHLFYNILRIIDQPLLCASIIISAAAYPDSTAPCNVE